VNVQRAKIVRTRPMFKDWSCEIELNVNTENFDITDVTEILEHCGDNVGLCDWRPKYGRFTVEKIS
jgi:hypothetical protein